MALFKKSDCIEQFLDQHLRSGDCVFDIGANQGLYTTRMLKNVGRDGKVFAFEPNPDLCAQLQANHGSPNLVTLDVAVSEADGQATFFVDTREGVGAVASSLKELDDLHAMKKVREITVETTTVDAICKRFGVTPQFIKIDVEGNELEVFRGATETIAESRPVMAFEFWETWWDKSVRRIFAYLREHYDLIRLQDGELVNDWYDENHGQTSVDIGCIPRRSNTPLDPTALS